MRSYTALLFLFVTLFSCSKQSKTPAGASAPNTRAKYDVGAIEGYVVRPSVLSESVTAAGSLLPAEETALHPEASGRVVSIHLPEGSTVRKGTLLLKIFDEDLRTQMQKLELQLKQAQITEQRLGDLLRVKGVSQQEYDLAVLATQTLQSEIELLKINIAKTELRAPYDGIIGLRNISPGAYVSPATAVATIRSASALKLDFSVPEKYSHLIRKGQNISFNVEGQEQTFNAVVQATEQSVDAETRNLKVRALVRDGQGKLLPGSFAEVALSLSSNTKALMIPSECIIPQARDKQVVVVRKGKADFVTVKTGVRQTGKVEITEGLGIGDSIATTGILFLRPGMPVKFAKVDGAD